MTLELFNNLLGNFPGGSDSKESAHNAGDVRDGGSIPGEGNGYPPTPIFLPGEFRGQRRVLGYSSWGRKELDVTEQQTLPHFQKIKAKRSLCIHSNPKAIKNVNVVWSRGFLF